MNFTTQQLVLSAAAASVLVLTLTLQMLPGEAQSSAPIDLEAKSQVAETSLQSSPIASKLRALVEQEPTPDIVDRAAIEDDAPQEEDAQGSKGNVCLVVKGASKHLGDGQGQVRITRVDPQIPTWSAEVMLVNESAQLGELPEGAFEIQVFSDALPRGLAQTLTWPNPDDKQSNELRFDLDEAMRRACEGRVVVTLRMMVGAQQQLQASAAIDCDGDGAGQYGFLGELAGTSPLRLRGVSGNMRGTPTQLLDPPYLSAAFGEIQAGLQYGCVLRGGYYYRVQLPAMVLSQEDPLEAVFEAPGGGVGLDPVDPAQGELFWGVYAWPADSNTPGRSTFFINQEGDAIKRHVENQAPYQGINSGPAFDAAFSSESPRDMRAGFGFASMGRTANDGGIWVPAGH